MGQDNTSGNDRKTRALVSALDLGMKILGVAMAAAVARQVVVSSVYIVPQHESAFVLRFGRISDIGSARIRQPGLHIGWPYPVDEVVSVPVGRVRSVFSDEFWHESRDGESVREGYTLTSDMNMLHSRWACRYLIRDPEMFAFGAADMDALVRNELNRAVIRACAQHGVDSIIRADAAFKDRALGILSERCRELKFGVEIERVDLLALSPPPQTIQAFDAVLRSEQEREGKANAARSAAEKSVNGAIGEAAGILARAEADKVRFTTGLRAEAGYFLEILDKDAQAPGSLRKVLLQEALQRALARPEEKYVLRGAPPGGRQEVRLLLAPEPRRPAIVEGTR